MTVARWFGRFFRAVGFIVVIAIVMLVVAELALRLYFTNFGTEQQRIRYLYNREQIAVLQHLIMPIPNIGFGLSPEHEGHNQLGYRGEEITLPKPEGVFRIVAIGGSTTYSQTEPNLTYPYQLEQVLRDQYGYDQVEVINAGVQGYTSVHIVSNFALRVLEVEPDLVIFYEGVNDIQTRSVDPECYRGNNVLRGVDPRGRIPNTGFYAPLSPFVLFRLIGIRLDWMRDPYLDESLFLNVDFGCDDGEPDIPAENVPLNPPVYYERNLITLVGVADIHNIDLMFASWAYLESDPAIEPYWRTAVAEHNAIVADIAQRYHIPFLDYAPLAPQEPEYWVEYIHMNGEGSHHLAESFAAFIDANGLINGE